MSDADNVPAIAPSLPEAQPMIPQPLVELHGWGRTSGTMTHLAAIDSVAAGQQVATQYANQRERALYGVPR